MKVTALTMKNLSHGTPCAVKAACTVWTGAKGSKESDLSVFLFRYEYSANFFYKLWKTIFYKGIMPSEKILDLPVDCNFLTGSVNL